MYALLLVLATISFLLNMWVVEYAFRILDQIKRVPPQVNQQYNAFARFDSSRWSRWKFYLFGWLFLPRILTSILCIISFTIWVKILMFNFQITPENKTSWRLKLVRGFGRIATRIMLLCSGFVWIRRERITVNFDEFPFLQRATLRPSTIVANHSSCMDILYNMSNGFPSFFAKQAIGRYPMIGDIARGMFCLFVDRASDNNRELLLNQIEERQDLVEKNPELPQLCLFVEGTTTNGTVLLNFKKGAFYSKRAVQPSAIRYWGPIFTPTMDIIPQVPHFLILHSQIFAGITILEYPPVEVRPELKASITWEQYVESVHNLMKQGMKVPSSSLSYRDKGEFQKIIFDSKKQD